MRVDPAAFRQTLLNSITDDGLEELTLRLAKPEYPSAHRSGPGRDAGIDVLSDMELPPQRAWQCKNHQKTNWDDCRASLASAMDDEHPPSHYTFVLPKPLTGPQREFWRRTFKPEQMTKHETLETLDLWDNLAEQLEDRAELVESLTDGALSGYIRQVNAEAAQTGVNPLASAPDLVGDTALLAERAVEMGRADPRFRYETRQREARPGDSAIPDGRIRLGFRAPIGQPREFTVTLRLDNAVQESAAGPREDVELPAISVWFSDTARGAEHRNSVRRQLALGQRVQLRLGPDLGLDAQPLPDRFAGMADPDGIFRAGETEIGLSEPVTLTIETDGPHGQSPPMPVELRRVPSEPGYEVSYAGAVHGVLVFLDLQPDATPPEGVEGRWTQSSIAAGLAIDGRPAAEALDGLGFAFALTRAERIHLECPGVMPAGGIDYDDTAQTAVTADEVLGDALTLAHALAWLEIRDERARPLPPEYSPNDLIVAQMVEALSHCQDVRIVVPHGANLPVDETFTLQDAASGLGPLGPIGGHPTVDVAIRAEQPAQTRLRVSPADGQPTVHHVDGSGQEAALIVSLVNPGGAQAPGSPD